jgi:hypothetical protein
VTFTLPTDRDYRRAKRIKQGTLRRDPNYDRFLERFDVLYGIAPLTVSLDSFDRPRGGGKTPRLAVVLERTREYQSFLEGRFNYDKTKQNQIAHLLAETVPAPTLRASYGITRLLHSTPSAEDIFVCFEDFESVARWEVHDLATTSELDEFTVSLGIADQCWCVRRLAGPPIVFVHTEEQSRALRASPMPVAWANAYYEIAKRHDEFGYINRAELAIKVDSKENFEANYSGNWYYYFK